MENQEKAIKKVQTTQDYGRTFVIYFPIGLVIDLVGGQVIGGVIGNSLSLLGLILLLVGLVNGVVWVFRKVMSKP